MADVKISGLPASTVPLAGTEVLPIVQSSTTKKVSIANVTAGRAVSALSFAPTGSALPINGLFLPGTNAVGIATDSEERARVFATGGVSIGNTTDPGAANLSVTGNITAPNLQGPAFSVYLSAPQATSSGVDTKVAFDTEVFDTNNNFASSRFTPTVAGYYQVNTQILKDGTVTRLIVSLFKNGSVYQIGSDITNLSAIRSPASFLVYMNGSSDYIEIYVNQIGGTGFGATGSADTWFSGCLVRSA